MHAVWMVVGCLCLSVVMGCSLESEGERGDALDDASTQSSMGMAAWELRWKLVDAQAVRERPSQGPLVVDLRKEVDAALIDMTQGALSLEAVVLIPPTSKPVGLHDWFTACGGPEALEAELADAERWVVTSDAVDAGEAATELLERHHRDRVSCAPCGEATTLCVRRALDHEDVTASEVPQLRGGL